jgi:hypothetical protein
MKDSSSDTGVIQTLLDRLNNRRLPRAQELKKRVDAGATLTEHDVQFLEQVLKDAHSIQPLVDRHPEYQNIVAGVLQLYKEIMDKALENERKV